LWGLVSVVVEEEDEEDEEELSRGVVNRPVVAVCFWFLLPLRSNILPLAALTSDELDASLLLLDELLPFFNRLAPAASLYRTRPSSNSNIDTHKSQTTTCR
jgi:hypothetical protein